MSMFIFVCLCSFVFVYCLIDIFFTPIDRGAYIACIIKEKSGALHQKMHVSDWTRRKEEYYELQHFRQAGRVTFTVSLAREVAPHGIDVNCVAPGMMRTSMNKNALAEREDSYLEQIPLRRIADPSEVAAVVAFLCSSQSDYMTGTTLDVTGGMLMR